MSLSETLAATGQTRPRISTRPIGDRVLHALTLGSAILVLVVLGGVFVSLVQGALPALSTFGFKFLVDETWNPATEVFGADASRRDQNLIDALSLEHSIVRNYPINCGNQRGSYRRTDTA